MAEEVGLKFFGYMCIVLAVLLFIGFGGPWNRR